MFKLNVMAAEKGNKYAIGNNGGRPSIYNSKSEDDINKVAELCESYYEWIKGEEDNDGKKIRQSEPPTVTGLALHLGFCNKSTLYDYANIKEFSNSIKRALTKIEQYHEIATSMGDKCTGNIFILKNFGWQDTIKTEHSGSIDNPSASPTIVFKKFENNGE